MEIVIDRELAAKVLSIVDKGLVKGLGDPKPGKMCVEAAVNYAMGADHGDSPACVGAAVRAFKIRLNDAAWPTNKDRTDGMRKLAIAQLGSDTIDQKAFRLEVAFQTIRQIVPIALRAAAKLNPKFAEALELCSVACEIAQDLSVARTAVRAALEKARETRASAAAAYAAYAAAAAAAAASAAASAAAASAYAAADAAAAADADAKQKYRLKVLDCRRLSSSSRPAAHSLTCAEMNNMAASGGRTEVRKLPELEIAIDPYPHLRNANGCVLARDYESSDAQEYVKRANAYPRLVEWIKGHIPEGDLDETAAFLRELGELE